jgi:hypothetical protein
MSYYDIDAILTDAEVQTGALDTPPLSVRTSLRAKIMISAAR